jgi:hypothetical protein
MLLDAGYGANTDLRTNIAALTLTYVANIQPNATVWVPGLSLLRPKMWSGCGRPPKLIRRDRNHRPISLKELALGLPAKAWRTIPWREGSTEQLSGNSPRIRVQAGIGLGHFEGRGWRGLHYHATLCISAYGFPISERETIFPSAPRVTALFRAPVVPEGYKPRGAANAIRTAHSKFDCDRASTAHLRPCQKPASMSMLHRSTPWPNSTQKFVTQ